MKVICVTGTPGTGKTKYSKTLAKEKSYLYVDVKKLIDTFKLADKYDRSRKSYVIDTDLLNKVLIEVIKVSKKEKVKGLVIDSHLSHELPKRYVDVCIEMRTDIKKLRTRLMRRKYHKAKIEENIESEIMQVILEEARFKKHKIKIINN